MNRTTQSICFLWIVIMLWLEGVELVPADIDPDTYDAYVGRYDFMGLILTITKEGNRLFAQLTGQPKAEIFPGSETEFFWKVVDAQITFVKNEKGEVTHAIHRQGGREFKALKLKDEPPAEVDSAILDAYVGEYDYGNSMILTVTKEGDRLFAQMTGQLKFEIFPRSKTEFFWKVVDAQITFVKNEEGEVTHAIYRQGGQELKAPKLFSVKELTRKQVTTITPIKPSGTRPPFFADLEVSNPRFVEPSGNRALDAEERGRIVFTLENRGRGVAEEVDVSLVLLTDATRLTYPKTTQIGSLASEAKKEVEIPVTANLDVAAGTATFRIAVSEKWGFEPDPFTITFDTKAFVPPQLVIDDANIGIDDDKQGDSYGDNDSKIELKETIEVTVAVQNTGAGDAEGVKAEVTIEGEGQDIYYNSPSAIFELGNIPAGDYKQFTFAFSTNNRYKRRDLPITVNITESKGKYGLTKLLGLTVDTPIKSSRDVVVTKIEQPQRTVTLTAPILTSLADKAPTNAIPQFSDAVAVIFGIEEYRSAPPATFANRDATIFYDYAKSVFGIPERNIHLATNELATKGTFDKVFGEDGWISRRVTPNETEVFLFYSGHGAPSTDKSQYLIPQDADPNYAKTTGVALNQLYESLNKLKAKHVMIFIDACFSGAGRPIEKEQKPMLLADARPIFVTVEGPLAYGNMTVMTASTGAQISSGYPDQKHGLFTFYLLMGLHGEADLNSDKAVTVGELKNYLEKNIPDKALELYDREQTPVVQTNEVGRVIVQFK
jgi:hypothetical protein